MISTDKAVNSRSIMGASKRLAEIMLAARTTATTRMTWIRLGNVLGSEGSVVLVFLEQIAHGGPVTVSDPDVERYFLTMEATVERIFTTAAGCPVEPAVAIPIMGEPVKIADLARYLIAQSGMPNVEIVYTGLRPCDKLQEEFVAASETIIRSNADGIYWVNGPIVSGGILAAGLAEFEAALKSRDLSLLLATMIRLVPEYLPSDYVAAQASAAAAR